MAFSSVGEPRLIARRTRGPLFLTDRKAPAGMPTLDVCPETGRARLSYRRGEEIFEENTRLLANPLASRGHRGPGVDPVARHVASQIRPPGVGAEPQRRAAHGRRSGPTPGTRARRSRARSCGTGRRG
ncbi:hypothetical protein ACH4FX_30495 [Streptomyces sp. NPDC018019]|uniref:hypothetical protein n=1 Tax=Streptomyces sp. NPDC018019 TaxID=3365030 RepID=UPI0037B18407